MRYVVTFPNDLSDAQMQNVQRRLEEGRDMEYVVMAGGGRITPIAAINVATMLSDGPLDGIGFQQSLASLDDLPDMFPFRGGRYVRWTSVGSQQIHGMDGQIIYHWESDGH